jgi:hypothetical protein
MSAMDTTHVADMIARSTGEMGLVVTRDQSRRSESQYVYVGIGGDDHVPVKVRVACHEAMPWNGAGDIEVDPARMDGVHWTAAVIHLAGRFGRTAPAWVRAQATRRANAARAKAEAEMARAAADAAHRADIDGRVSAAFPAEWAAAEAKTGAERREAKRLLRRRYEAQS